MTEGSKAPASLLDKVNVTANASINRSSKGKVPKRIHKAEREKLKREHLNELFLELANALELTQQNSGKASVLCEATRLLKDLLGQIESLKKENVSLLSESHYVTMEKTELKEENSTLETQISELQTEIGARENQSKPDLNIPPPEYHQHHPATVSDGGLQQPPPGPTAVLVLPLQPDHQTACHAYETMTEVSMKPTSKVTKPHPRYPSAADSWQSQLLKEQLSVGEKVQGSGSSSSSGDSSGAL